VDRAMQFRHLAEAEQHIAISQRHVAEQERRVAEFELYGYDTTIARSLLSSFRMSLAQHIAHRDRIVEELEEGGSPVPNKASP
jgi:hypothetical protein